MENVITRFSRAFREKYRDGQARHQGEVWQKPSMLKNAVDEALDQVCYLDVLNEQIATVASGLRDGSMNPAQAADLLERMLA